MKKNSFVLATLFAATFANAQQVTLQHTFEKEEINLIQYDYSTNKSLMYTENVMELYGNAYYSIKFDTLTYNIKRYNADYSYHSTRTFNIPVINEYYACNVTVTKTIFDDDESNYELVVLYRKIGSWYGSQDRNSEMKAMVYTENGSIIADLGTGYNLYVYPYLHIYNNEYRFYVRRYNYTNTAYESGRSDTYYYNFDIYKVNKQNANNLQQVSKENLPKKVLIDGKVYIIAGEKVIDVLGREVK